MRGFTFLIFVVMTFLCWGVYGPVLHVGQIEMGAGGQRSSFRPFICVGIAYFLIAVVYPTIVLMTKGEQGNWSTSGFVWSFASGAIGAAGALGIILAFKFHGEPVFVMPLVFGLAPVVNTLVTMLMSGTIRQASIWFLLGVLVVAIGGAGVMFFKPASPHVEHAGEATDQSSADENAVAQDDVSSGRMFVILSIAATALCWGAYGPVLHRGQSKMGGSRLRPFFCVGLAYFVIAVIGPILIAPAFPAEPGGWTVNGTFWSLCAGAAGAIGALGIIYAFNFGGKPIFVMPLVFGFAPVVNTFTTIISENLYGMIDTMFYLSLMLVILGAVTVLVCAPRGGPPKPAGAEK